MESIFSLLSIFIIWQHVWMKWISSSDREFLPLSNVLRTVASSLLFVILPVGPIFCVLLVAWINWSNGLRVGKYRSPFPFLLGHLLPSLSKFGLIFTSCQCSDLSSMSFPPTAALQLHVCIPSYTLFLLVVSDSSAHLLLHSHSMWGTWILAGSLWSGNSFLGLPLDCLALADNHPCPCPSSDDFFQVSMLSSPHYSSAEQKWKINCSRQHHCQE